MIIIRQQLLIEAVMVTRRTTRVGPVYLYRHVAGPAAVHDDKIDRFLLSAAQAFDFGPVMMGDQQQARQVAQDYASHLVKRARQSKVPRKVLKKRLKEMSPHLRRSLMTFFTYLDAKLKTSM